MSYSNGLLPDQSYQTANKYVQRGLPGVGFKLAVTGDYDMQNKKLTNVKSGTDSNDASSIGDGGSGPCCAKNPTQKNVPKTPPRKKPV